MRLVDIRVAQAEAANLTVRPEVAGVEQLNPRSRAVKTLEMAVRRADGVAQLCEQHLTRCEGDIRVARSTSPTTWGSIDKKPGSDIANPRTLVRTIFGDAYWAHPEWPLWSSLFDAWYDGRIRRQREAVLANLPATIRNKYEF